MKLTAIVKALVATGATPEQIAAAVEAAEQSEDVTRQTKREQARIRKQRQRARDAAREPVTHVTRDACDIKEKSPTPPKENNPPSPPKGGHIPPLTNDHLQAIERAYPKAGLVNANPQAMLVPIGKAAVKLGGPDALIAAMRAYGRAVEAADSKPVGLRKFLDPHEGLLDRYAPAKADPGAERQSWQAKLDMWARNGRWPAAWGPDPRSPHCQAPPDLIAKAREGETATRPLTVEPHTGRAA